MKKIKTIMLSAFLLGVIFVNLFIVSNDTSGSISLSSIKQAFAEGVENTVTPVCGATYGICWEEKWVYKDIPEGGRIRVRTCPTLTTNTDKNCVPDEI